jgi:hypothetical protein
MKTIITRMQFLNDIAVTGRCLALDPLLSACGLNKQQTSLSSSATPFSGQAAPDPTKPGQGSTPESTAQPKQDGPTPRPGFADLAIARRPGSAGRHPRTLYSLRDLRICLPGVQRILHPCLPNLWKFEE